MNQHAQSQLPLMSQSGDIAPKLGKYKPLLHCTGSPKHNDIKTFLFIDSR